MRLPALMDNVRNFVRNRTIKVPYTQIQTGTGGPKIITHPTLATHDTINKLHASARRHDRNLFEGTTAVARATKFNQPHPSKSRLLAGKKREFTSYCAWQYKDEEGSLPATEPACTNSEGYYSREQPRTIKRRTNTALSEQPHTNPPPTVATNTQRR